jgi:hypothetical protein
MFGTALQVLTFEFKNDESINVGLMRYSKLTHQLKTITGTKPQILSKQVTTDNFMHKLSKTPFSTGADYVDKMLGKWRGSKEPGGHKYDMHHINTDAITAAERQHCQHAIVKSSIQRPLVSSSTTPSQNMNDDPKFAMVLGGGGGGGGNSETTNQKSQKSTTGKKNKAVSINEHSLNSHVNTTHQPTPSLPAEWKQLTQKVQEIFKTLPQYREHVIREVELPDEVGGGLGIATAYVNTAIYRNYLKEIEALSPELQSTWSIFKGICSGSNQQYGNLIKDARTVKKSLSALTVKSRDQTKTSSPSPSASTTRPPEHEFSLIADQLMTRLEKMGEVMANKMTDEVTKRLQASWSNWETMNQDDEEDDEDEEEEASDEDVAEDEQEAV